MIRYPISESELIKLIDKIKPDWRTRAALETQRFIDAKDYLEGSDFWGEIKEVYIDLQYEKCAYCETKLQGKSLASKVHEVEHFRPKSSIKVWPNPKSKRWKLFKPSWVTGAASKTGYFRLTYHPLNYAIACTRCNSTLKSNYFPIKGKRDLLSAHPVNMQSESQLLLYPISSVDIDAPEDIISFDGVLAVPAHDSGSKYERAVTNIEFFQLNHQDLTTRRGKAILGLWTALMLAKQPGQEEFANSMINMLCSPENEFSACLCAFRTLFSRNFVKAQQIQNLLAEALLKERAE
ncbi:hypothetical protein [Pseudomonas sp. Pseu.R1]|uniref:hypothetical protein n=1 Tax=Pseudomonas sp. Pseu.R1 TaxID=3379818 RepID=UPI003B92985E